MPRKYENHASGMLFLFGITLLVVGAVIVLIAPALQFYLQPGEWGPRPWYFLTIYVAILGSLLVSVIAIVFRRRAFVWVLLAIQGLCFLSELQRVISIARSFNDFNLDGEIASFDWTYDSIFLLSRLLLLVASAYVYLGPVGTRYFRGRTETASGVIVSTGPDPSR